METRIGMLGDDKELFTKYAQALIDGISKVIKSFEIIRDVSKKMDGMVLNVRFPSAIKRLTVQNKSGVSYSISLKGYKREMCFSLEKGYIQNKGTSIYFDKDIANYISFDVERDLLSDGRISYDKIDSTLTRLEKSYREKIEKWRDGVENFDKYKNVLCRAIADFGEKMENINGLFKPLEISSYDWERARKEMEKKS